MKKRWVKIALGVVVVAVIVLAVTAFQCNMIAKEDYDEDDDEYEEDEDLD